MVETFTTRITPYGLDRRVFIHLPDDVCKGWYDCLVSHLHQLSHLYGC